MIELVSDSETSDGNDKMSPKRKRKSTSARARKIREDGVNVCATCGNPKKHKSWCSIHVSLIQSGMRRHAFETEEPADQNFEETDAVDNESLLEYLNSVWEAKRTKLPTLRGLSQKSFALDKNLWPTWSYTNPDPSVHPDLPQTPISYSVAATKVYVLCPHTFWAHLLCDHSLVCPECGKSGVALDGWTEGFREVTSLASRSFIKTRRYRHRDCPAAKQKGKMCTVFSSLHPGFIRLLPEAIVSQIDVIAYKKSMFKTEIATYAREIQQHCSFRAGAEVHHTLLTTEKALRERRHLLVLLAMQSTCIYPTLSAYSC